MAVSSVAAQAGICASPVSVAVVSMITFMATAGHNYSVLQILSIAIPATGLGVFFAALWSTRRGKELADDPEFQKLISDPANKEYVYGDTESLLNKELPKSFYYAMLIFFCGIIVIAILGNFNNLLPHFANAKGELKAISMTAVIQMVMLMVAAIILIVCKVKAKEVGKTRLQALEDALKDCKDENFKAQTLKDFGRMSFASDDDFNEYLSGKTADVKTANQRVADDALRGGGAPLFSQKEAETGVSKGVSEFIKSQSPEGNAFAGKTV